MSILSEDIQVIRLKDIARVSVLFLSDCSQAFLVNCGIKTDKVVRELSEALESILNQMSVEYLLDSDFEKIIQKSILPTIQNFLKCDKIEIVGVDKPHAHMCCLRTTAIRGSFRSALSINLIYYPDPEYEYIIRRLCSSCTGAS